MQKSKLRDSFRPKANFAMLRNPAVAAEGLRLMNQEYINSRVRRSPLKNDESYPVRLTSFTDRNMREIQE
ncbi:hypothetical protein JXA56_05595 [Candidatus Micrarchaeota archaeon]|nr:hypothetical protein [Candidatus Micrarchaeota archaeon]